jgi:cytokinin dehydrogenase
MIQANQALLLRLRAAGGKIYPPYSPILSSNEWREHYGPETWRRFAAAKERFDSNNVLTPGAGIFYAHNLA